MEPAPGGLAGVFVIILVINRLNKTKYAIFISLM